MRQVRAGAAAGRDSGRTCPPVPTELISVLITHTGSVQQEQEPGPISKTLRRKAQSPYLPENAECAGRVTNMFPNVVSCGSPMV